MLPQWGKSADDDQNLISSEGGQDTSACQISCHSKWLQYILGEESTLWSLMLPQTPSEKAQFKKMPKIENLSFGLKLCWVNNEGVSSFKIKSGCNKNSDEESTFTLHGHKTKSKLQIKRNWQKFNFWNYQNNLNLQHTFWSWLIRCVNMKWIQLNIVEDTERTQFCPHRQMDRWTNWWMDIWTRLNQYTPLSILLNNKKMILKLKGYQAPN